jgi:hypothetical protein
MMKNYMTTRTVAKDKKPEGDSSGKAAAPFHEEMVVMSIYGGPAPHEYQHKLKLTSWVVNVMSTVVPEYLHWSESLITFDQMDHPLIVDLLVGMTRLTRALMDRGSDLNHMYLDTFDGLGLTQDHHQSSPHPFYGGVPGKKSIPLGWVTKMVISGDASNYRTKTFIFEMVDFSRPYHVILEWPCYVKFMAILFYAYLKLKIPGPARVITVEAKAQQTLNYEHDNIELATAMVITSE